MPAKVKVDACLLKVLKIIKKFCNTVIGQGDISSLRPEKPRQATTGRTGSDNCYLLVSIISLHRVNTYLNFNVERPIKARMILMIQNRTIIFGSAQPFNSK